jgi:hypothetical protein
MNLLAAKTAGAGGACAYEIGRTSIVKRFKGEKEPKKDAPIARL